jgi:hypothetical protein
MAWQQDASGPQSSQQGMFGSMSQMFGGGGYQSLGNGGYSITTPNAPEGPGQDVLSGLQSLVDKYNQAYTEAKNANEQRYNQMLGIANQTTNQQATDIRSQYAQQAAQGMQNLNRVGMGNTTVGNTMNLGIQNQQSQALNRLADQMQQTKLGIINSRQDPYPNASSLQSIIAGIGSSYGGGTGISAILNALGGMKQGGGVATPGGGQVMTPGGGSSGKVLGA